MAMQRVRVLTSLLSRLPSRAGAPLQWRSSSNISARFRVYHTHQQRRYSGASDKDYNRELDDINSKFAEAREEIELALESKETVYFNEEADTARMAVQDVLQKYEALLGKLSPESKGQVQRSMGLKMEQLKAELAQLKE